MSNRTLDKPGVEVLYIDTALGCQNVFLSGRQISFSQQGNFTSAIFDGPNIAVVGPNVEWPNGFLIPRLWDIHNKLIIFVFNGQSNTVGATANMANIADPTVPFMQLPPLPGILKAYTGGFTPNQDGVGSNAVTTIWNAAQLGALVDGHENINTGRTPGDEVNRQMWSSMFGQVIAAAVPDDCKVLIINAGCGGTDFAADVQKAVFLSTASWVGGQVTFTFVSNTHIAVGDQFTINSSNPAGYNDTYTAITSDGIHVTASLPGNPGAYVGSGFGIVMSEPMVNIFSAVRYAVNTVAPALGLQPLMGALCYNGNEANGGNVQSPANWFIGQFTPLQGYTNLLGQICGNVTDPYIIWPQIGYPIDDWHEADDTLFSCVSRISLGLLAAAPFAVNRLITFPQYAAVAGDGGDTAGACIHYGVQGHSDHGEKAANLFLDVMISNLSVAPLQLLEGEGQLTRVANSTIVNGIWSQPAMVDVNAHITNPGQQGIKAFANVVTGENGLSVTVDSVTVSGTTFQATLDTLPSTGAGNFIGVADNNAVIFQQPNNTVINNATWAGNVATYTTVAPHGLSPGDIVTIALMNPAGYNIIPGTAALAGTTGSTIKMSLTPNPGAYVSGGSVANNGTYGIARAQGQRSQIRIPTIKDYSNNTGAPLHDWAAMQRAQIDVYSSGQSIVTMLSELGLTSSFPFVHDYGNGTCYTSGATVTNLGTGTTADDYTLSGSPTPTFNGVAGALNRSNFFSVSAPGPFFAPTNTPDVLVNAHKAAGQFTIICGGFCPAGLANSAYEIATCKGEGSSQGPGVFLRIATNFNWTIGVEGDAGSQVFTRTSDSSLAANNYYLIAVSIQASNNQSWMYTFNFNGTPPFGVSSLYNHFSPTFNPVYASPSVAAAQSLAYIWQNGSTGTTKAPTGMQTMFKLVSNTFMTQTTILPLLRSLYRRQILQLP